MEYHGQPTEPARSFIPPHAGVRAALDGVDIRAELDERPLRPPAFEREHRALATLASEMADNPRHMLQTLAEIAAELCDAGSAGVSLIEGDVLRWEAVAGVFASSRGTTMPRDASPCGVCIERGSTQLMHLPDRCFPALAADPRFVESLIVPVDDHGTPIGTVWVASHGVERKFNRQDERTVQVLARFASAGWQLWKAYAAASETGRRKGDFLATLALGLRNPLAAIAGAVSILRLRTASDATSATHAIDVIARQTQQVTRIVYDLMDATRTANAKLELARQRVDLREVTAEPLEALLTQPGDRRQSMINPDRRGQSMRQPPDSARSSSVEPSRRRGQLHAGRR